MYVRFHLVTRIVVCRDESRLESNTYRQRLLCDVLHLLFSLVCEHLFDVPGLRTHKLFYLFLLLKQHFKIFLFLLNHTFELEHN